MSLTAITSPQSESELSVMLCTLEAHGIPAFVQGGGFGSLYPGPQISAYNARRIMVPDAYVAPAKEALHVFVQPLEPAASSCPTIFDKFRIILELIIFGWFIPGGRGRAASASNPLSKRTREKPRAA